MDVRAGASAVHYVEHGAGRPVLVLHGAGVDHREPEACFEPVLGDAGDLRRLYPDLPGMGRTTAGAQLRSAEDVLDVLLEFAERVTAGTPYLLIGHSAGAYFAQAMASRRPGRVAGLALVCPLLPAASELPAHRTVVGPEEMGDEVFRDYFVVHTQEMLERYRRHVAPGAALADEAALARIGERWELAPAGPEPYGGPTLIMAGRLDSTAGFRAALDLAATCPAASVAVLDDTGHALPHEQPEVLHAMTMQWLARVDRHTRSFG